MLSREGKQHELYGVRIDDMEKKDLLAQVRFWFEQDGQHIIFTPNPEFILLSEKNPEFKTMLNRADVNIPDGVGLRFAVAALTDDYLRNRYTGVDLLSDLASECAKQHKRLLLLGGQKGSAFTAAEQLRKKYPALDVTDCDPGYLSGGIGDVSFSQKQVREVNEMKPDVLAVALGQGKQEQFILQHLSRIPSVKIAVGVGGSFESIAGTKKRAPKRMRQMGLEWVWRLVIEPSRIKRIFTAFPGFPIRVAWSTIRHRRFIKACRRVFPEIIRQIKGL